MATHSHLPCCRRSDSKGGQEVLVIETSSGQHITLQNSPASVVIEDANGNVIRLDPSGIIITSVSQIAITAAMVTVNASMTNFSGVVQADTVIANSVIAASIAPGAGNIW